MDRTTRGPAAHPVLLLAVVAIVGLNLRPFLTGVGPLTEAIRAETGLDLQGMALLTLLPMLLMGCCAFAGPALQRKLGSRRAAIGALAVLALGSALRLFAFDGWELLGTAVLLGLGAAIVQAVFPGIVKHQFPRHVTLVMGLYSSMLMGGGAVGAQAAPVVAGIFSSWRIGLAWMALPAVLAVVMAMWLLPADAERPAESLPAMALLKRPRAWLLMICFGLVNGGYASVVAWLSPFYQGHGWTSAASGNLLALMAISQALSALLLPALANRNEDRRPWLWLTLLMQVAGFAGLAFWPDASPVFWAILLGAGLGGCFALSMVVALDHLPDPHQAGALSALMQGGGFLIAAIAPWLVAVLHDATGGFVAGWVLHLGCVGLVTMLVARFAPRNYARAMNSPAPGGSLVKA